MKKRGRGKGSLSPATSLYRTPRCRNWWSYRRHIVVRAPPRLAASVFRAQPKWFREPAVTSPRESSTFSLSRRCNTLFLVAVHYAIVAFSRDPRFPRDSSHGRHERPPVAAVFFSPSTLMRLHIFFFLCVCKLGLFEPHIHFPFSFILFCLFFWVLMVYGLGPNACLWFFIFNFQVLGSTHVSFFFLDVCS